MDSLVESIVLVSIEVAFYFIVYYSCIYFWVLVWVEHFFGSNNGRTGVMLRTAQMKSPLFF